MLKSNRWSLTQAIEQVYGFIDIEMQKPLTVSVMGQTGVGKSSLINALFDTDFPTSSVSPGTTDVEKRETRGKNNHPVTFYDLPGIGETAQNGKEWIPKYQDYLRESDVAIWAVHADTRSFMLDQTVLGELIEKETPENKTALLSKIVFVLTKTDHLTNPKHMPPVRWAAKATSSNGDIVLAPDNYLTGLIKDKEAYFEKKFMGPFKPFITVRTHYKGRFKVEIPGMHCEAGFVYYDHFVEEEKQEEWTQQYPKYAYVFQKLRENCGVIPCSALFRHNLDPLMNVIIDKLEFRSAGRFKGFAEWRPMDRMPYFEAQKLINIVPLNSHVQTLLTGGVM
jgi:GTPase Era involved in 16S rRNA processing